VRLFEARPLVQKTDTRGRVFEVLRREQVPENGFGQIYVFTGSPGSVKGNHYHTRKTEWFCVISGDGELILCDPESQQRECIMLSGEHPTVVTIPAGVVHAIRNLGETELVVIAYTTEPYDPGDPDTWPFQLA
jgi:dTDP-4-dehydrorhamnose 3,5-epimerase-like enzyme